VIFRLIITLLLPFIAVNREIGLVIHYTFVDRFCREKNLRQELHPSFDDRILTCCGFRCGFFVFAVDSHLCQILFDSVVMNLDLPPQFTRYDPLFVSSRTLDDERAHFFPEPIFSTLSQAFQTF
jgi:hypothetical protein